MDILRETQIAFSKHGKYDSLVAIMRIDLDRLNSLPLSVRKDKLLVLKETRYSVILFIYYSSNNGWEDINYNFIKTQDSVIHMLEYSLDLLLSMILKESLIKYYDYQIFLEFKNKKASFVSGNVLKKWDYLSSLQDMELMIRAGHYRFKFLFKYKGSLKIGDMIKGESNMFKVVLTGSDELIVFSAYSRIKYEDSLWSFISSDSSSIEEQLSYVNQRRLYKCVLWRDKSVIKY